MRIPPIAPIARQMMQMSTNSNIPNPIFLFSRGFTIIHPHRPEVLVEFLKERWGHIGEALKLLASGIQDIRKRIVACPQQNGLQGATDGELVDGDGEQTAMQVLWVLVGFKGVVELLDALLEMTLLCLQCLCLLRLAVFVCRHTVEEEGELLEGRRCLTTHLLRGDRHLLGDGSSAVAT